MRLLEEAQHRRKDKEYLSNIRNYVNSLLASYYVDTGYVDTTHSNVYHFLSV